MRLFQINIFKTLYFNFKYLPFSQARKLPVIIYKGVLFNKAKGKVEICASHFKPGLIQIGKRMLGNTDVRYSRTIWELSGNIIFKGRTTIGQGSKITVGEKGTLSLGCEFVITGGGTAIICNKNISFGDNCLLSWDILIMDTDYHKILNENNEIINEDKPIRIGNHVWIGCRNTILKGVTIDDNNVIGANSTITKSFKSSGCVIGNNAQILKSNIGWDA